MIAEASSLYAVLGLTEQEATTDKIKEAFRQRMLEWHPDKNQHAQLRQERLAAAQRIIEAYKILSNPELRRQYDLQLTSTERKTRSGHFEQIRVRAGQLQSSLSVHYDCEQCQGANSVTVKLEPFVDFVLVCEHCGVRSRLVLDCE